MARLSRVAKWLLRQRRVGALGDVSLLQLSLPRISATTALYTPSMVPGLVLPSIADTTTLYEPVIGAVVPFSEWLGQDVATRIVAAELQPSETLGGWSLTAGKSNTYEVAFAHHIATAQTPGGIYRRLDFVQQNDIKLSGRASVDAVELNAGSYFYDEVNETLYVHTTGAVSPDVYAAMQAYFSLFFATAPVDHVGGRLYEPRMTGRAPAIRSVARNRLFGARTFFDGSIELANADGVFDVLGVSLNWKNKRATIRLGGTELLPSEWRRIAVMEIEDIAPNDVRCMFELRQLARVLQRTVPINTYTPDEFPDLGDGVSGAHRPLLYGSMTGLPVPLVDAVNDVYEVADPTYQQLLSIDGVTAVKRSDSTEVGLSEVTHYAVDLVACTVTITDSTYRWQDYEIRVDASGKPDGMGGVIETSGEVLADLLENVLGVSSADINSASFDAADDEVSFALGLWINEAKPAADIVELVEASVLGSLLVGTDGRWEYSVWDPTYDISTLPTLSDEDFVSWEPSGDIESVFWKVRVRYAYSFATRDWVEASSESAKVKYENDVAEEVSIKTALTSSAAATTIAQRYRLIAGTPTIDVEFEARGLALMSSQLFDKVAVTRARAPDASGAWVNHVVQLVELDRGLSPPSVRARIDNLFGFGLDIGQWTDDSAPNWASATATERETQGFWTDDDGLIDPSDATSRNKSVWW